MNVINMQTCYYIFNDIGDVIAIFKNKEFAQDYLDHMMMPEDNCRIGMLADNVFRFEEHDAKYHTLQDSSLKDKRHMDCDKFHQYYVTSVTPSSEMTKGYCFLNDIVVDAFDKACNIIQERK